MLYDYDNGYNSFNAVVPYENKDNVDAVMCYHGVREGEQILQNVKSILKGGLKSSGKTPPGAVTFPEAYKESIFFRPYKQDDSVTRYKVGVKMKPEAKVAHQEFRIDWQAGNKSRYNGSTMSLSEYNELDKTRPAKHYIDIYKKFQTWDKCNGRDIYTPECVINAECIGLDNISYLSPLCIDILKQMYEDKEVDSSNLLVQRFCPELIPGVENKAPNNLNNLDTTEGRKGKDFTSADYLPNAETLKQIPETLNQNIGTPALNSNLSHKEANEKRFSFSGSCKNLSSSCFSQGAVSVTEPTKVESNAQNLQPKQTRERN